MDWLGYGAVWLPDGLPRHREGGLDKAILLSTLPKAREFRGVLFFFFFFFFSRVGIIKQQRFVRHQCIRKLDVMRAMSVR